MAKRTVIKVAGLKKHYKDIRAVDGISFDVARGQIFSFLGPNGAGKTTSVEMMEGLRTPTAGKIEILGTDVTRDYGAIRNRVGILPQDFVPFERLKPPETVEYFAALFGRKMTKDDIGKLLETVELGHRRNIVSKKLSGGEKRKLGIALALVGDPELLFLDEPTTGLDAQARRNLWGLLENLRDEGKTIFLTTHYLDEAEKLSDDVLIIHRGKEMARAPPEELIEKYGGGRGILLKDYKERTLKKLEDMGLRAEKAGDDVRVKLKKSDSARKVIRRIEDAGIRFGDFSTVEPNLEDAFIELVGGTIVGGELKR